MGAPGRYARHATFGRFRETPQSIVTLDDASALPGTDTMTVLIIGEMFRPLVGDQYPVDHSRQQIGDPGSSQGWGFLADPINGWTAFVGNGAAGFLTNAHTLARVPRAFVWSLSVTGGTFRSRFNDNELSQAAGAVAPNTTVVAALGVSGGFGGYASSFRVAAVLASMAEGVVDLATLHAVVENNLKQDRALDTGVNFTPEFYLDAADWPGYGVPPERVANEALTVTGGVERGELLGRVAA